MKAEKGAEKRRDEKEGGGEEYEEPAPQSLLPPCVQCGRQSMVITPGALFPHS